MSKKKKKTDWSLLANWLGKRVRGRFLVPQTSCESNGRKTTFNGVVVGIRTHRQLGRCLQVQEDPNDANDILVTVGGDVTHRLDGCNWTPLHARKCGFVSAFNSYIRGMKIYLSDGTEIRDMKVMKKNKKRFFYVEGTYAREDR